MTTTYFKVSRHIIAFYLSATMIVAVIAASCGKDDLPNQGGGQASSIAGDVLDKWMTMQIRLMRNATGIPNQAFSRHLAYSGITALESIAPGLPGNLDKYRKWNGLTGLPAFNRVSNYYLPANVNAAMASINRAMFPTANVTDKAAIDSLETALNQKFLATENASRINKSNEFGKAVAIAVFNWADNDGYKNAGAAYTPPVGAGLWEPTPPTNAAPSTPFWGNNRPVVTGSTSNTLAPAPLAYSTDPGSPFHQMVKKVYDASLVLTPDQNAMAIFWRDVPGITSPGHWLSILQQVIRQQGSKLDKVALGYALTGAAVNDALISCFKAKYTYNLVRPITYIRKTMGHGTWNTVLGTPPHPEYPSAHSMLSAAGAEAIQKIFGTGNGFTDHTYDYLGYGPRTYTSFRAIAEEAGQSRLYAGIHYQPSIDVGIAMGKKVAENIFEKNQK